MIERISIELTNQCDKRCHFCYNHSQPQGKTTWVPDEVVQFVRDCVQQGTKAVSFGGGEPLEYPGVFEVLWKLRGTVFRSLTSNGLHLHGDMLNRLVEAQPDKVHLSIHYPDQPAEVNRVIQQVQELEALGIRSGINLLVPRSKLGSVAQAVQAIHRAGIGNDRMVYLPMRIADTPTPKQIAEVSGGQPFQSMSCLTACQKSPRFCSISWSKQVGWCSYTIARRPLTAPTAEALAIALQDLPLIFCGGT